MVLVGTVLEATTFLFEVPTGVVADLVSRRLSVIIGFLLTGLAFVVEGGIATFAAALLGNVVWGIGYTFVSGALQAWITDEVGPEHVAPASRAGCRSTSSRASWASWALVLSVWSRCGCRSSSRGWCSSRSPSPSCW